MTKISVDYLDSLLRKEAEEIPPNGRTQEISANQTGENSSKPPALRAPIDKAMAVTGMAVAGAAGLAGGLSKVRTSVPLQELK